MSVAPSCPVLLIQDDESFRKGLVAALDRSHFAVTMAANGAEGIEKLQRGSFTVLILDLDLQKLDAQSVLDWVRDHRSDAPPKILIVTGATPTLRQQYDLKLAEEVLFKPVTVDYVVTRAQRYCAA